MYWCYGIITAIAFISTKEKNYRKIIGFCLGFFGCLFVVLVSIVCYFRGYSGYVSDIKKGMNNVDNKLCISAYYEITFDGYNQNTLTVVVSNNTFKDLKSATFVEKQTGTKIAIENVNAKDEKLTSVTLIPIKDGNYTFELVDEIYDE